MRLVPLLLLASAVAVLAAGCGVGGTTATVPAVLRAPPQTAALGWKEHYPATDAAIAFGVASFTVTETGWSARVSLQNSSDVSWEVGDPQYAAERAFGVMLFPNDDLDELEARNRTGTLPALRPATSIEPALPVVLRPGATWRGTLSAPGALAGGLWVRISFGPFRSVGDPPPGAASAFTWFTDHAHRLARDGG